MKPINPPSTNPPVDASTQHKGFFGRLMNWFGIGLKDVEKVGGAAWHDLLKAHIFNDVEAVGVSILEIIGQIYLNHIMMQGPVNADEAEGRFKQFAGSAAGQAIIMGGLNLAGSIPSLGQIDNLGQAAESVVNNLGFGYMNYQMMKPVIEHTSNAPLASKYRESAQSNTLDEEQITKAYNRGLLSESEMDSQLKELGYSSEFHPAIKSISQSVPDITTIQDMYNNKAISHEELVGYLKQSGYSNTDITNIATSMQKTAINPIQQEIADAIKALAADEHINDGQFRDMMQALGKTNTEIDQSLAAIRASQTIKGLQQEIDTLTSLYKQGVTSQATLQQQLKDLGLEEEHITSLIETQTQAILKANPTQRIIDLDTQLAKGLLTEQQYMKQLQDLGLGEQHAIAKLTQQQDKILSTLTTNQGKLGNTQTEINVAYAEGLLDESQFRTLSMQVGTEMTVIDSLVTALHVHATTSSKPIPLDIIQQGVFNRSIIQEQAIQMVQANGFSPTTSATIVEVWMKTASGQVGNVLDATGGGSTSGTTLTGKAIAELSPVRYTAQMTTFALNNTTQVSLLAMFYNSLIRGGYITAEQAIQLLHEIGLTQNEAELMLQ